MTNAKLFETEEYGQIVLFKDTDDNHCPCITLIVFPDGLGSCSMNLSSPDTDSGYETRDKLMDKITIEKAVRILKPVFDAAKEMVK